jgi:hypothetical protein
MERFQNINVVFVQEEICLLAGTIDATEKYSPTTINALTFFSTISQLSIILKLVRRTSDTIIAAAYLYQNYPVDSREPLYAKLENDVATTCGLDHPNQMYQIMKYIYGLADAGNAYYIAYSEHMMSNVYKISKMDPCLFYKITDIEITFIMIHVDDTFICRNKVEFKVL